jgi:hemerythrin-like domain-containing protein
MAHSVNPPGVPRSAPRRRGDRAPAHLRRTRLSDTIGSMKRSRELKPLSSEHHQALLVAFQLKKGLAGHAESAGAPKDLPGLAGLARRFEEQVFRGHARAEEELLGKYLAPDDMTRLRSEHAELHRLVAAARGEGAAELRPNLGAFADLLERHVRWEERELFPYAEDHVDDATLASIGADLERRLVLARGETKSSRR